MGTFCSYSTARETESPIHNGQISRDCLLYTSDADDALLCVDIGGRRFIKKNKITHVRNTTTQTHTSKTFPILT